MFCWRFTLAHAIVNDDSGRACLFVLDTGFGKLA